MGLGTLVLLLILSLVFKRDFFSLVGAGGVGTETAAGLPAETTPEEEKRVSSRPAEPRGRGAGCPSSSRTRGRTPGR
jgi:hypothetical protein